jgi:hypothetical protein
MSTTAEKLWETTRTLLEPMLAEILDFAEFLQSKRGLAKPARTAVNLTAVCGGLEQSAAFREHPLFIKGRRRDGWR